MTSFTSSLKHFTECELFIELFHITQPNQYCIYPHRTNNQHKRKLNIIQKR